MKRYIYAALAVLLMLSGCEYHPYYDGQVMRVYQSRYGLIEGSGVHLNVPIADRHPYELEIYGGKGKNHKVTVSDPDVLSYRYKEASVEAFLGQDIVPATLTLDPHRLGDATVEITDEDTGETILLELHVVNVFNMVEVSDSQNSLELGIVLAFGYPTASEDIRICRRDEEGAGLEYIMDAKCRFYGSEAGLEMELVYLADENGQPYVHGTEITKIFVVEFADGYSYGGPAYLLRIMNLDYLSLQTRAVKDYMEETEYDSEFRFIDVTENERPDMESPDTKIFFAKSAKLIPWFE